MLLTIFTPVYNRAYIIDALYNSLCAQSIKDFEWLVIDDGSTDNIKDIIGKFIKEDVIKIRFFSQHNGGKHRAINYGLTLALGELFFIVDSDDYLPPNAVENIFKYYSSIKNDDSFVGVSGLRFYPSGQRICGNFPYVLFDSTYTDLRFKYKIKGDMAEIFKTNVLRQFPFPEIAGEKFCPEALVWNRISSKYKLRYFNQNIYVCDYLSDGLSAKIVQLRMQSPITSMLYYSELYNMDIPLVQKLKAAINYWRFSFCADVNIAYKINQIGFGALFMYPLGLLFHLKDRRI